MFPSVLMEEPINEDYSKICWIQDPPQQGTTFETGTEVSRSDMADRAVFKCV